MRMTYERAHARGFFKKNRENRERKKQNYFRSKFQTMTNSIFKHQIS